MHNVTYEGYTDTQEVITSSYFALLNYDPYTCVPGVITITLYADDVESSTHSETIYTETTSVENLVIGEDGEDSTIVASWEIPTQGTEYCDFVYHISYVDPNGDTQETTTTDLQYDFGLSLSSCQQVSVTVTPLSLSSCQQVSVTVTPYHQNTYGGVSADTSYEGPINAVRNYALGSNLGDVVANFDPPTGIENCDITYEVRETETECYTKEVNVAAYNGRIYSEWVSGIVEVEVSAVESLQANIADASIEVNWREPNSAAACAVTYQIDVNDLTVINSGSSATIPVSNLPACVATNVTVTPISSSGKVGVPAYIGVTPELGVVEDLALTSGNNVVVASWSVPENADDCELSYLLEYTNESGVHWYVTEDTSYSFDYASCVDVSLVVVAHGADGSESGRASASLPA
ncbi:hypothetical protein QE152_g25197 [Popillia japonica]|uniref:Fibronectin type-III domain-containing protein n=1 Tax=Popillia japonica TaxID=7064 RepID=A0AAW1K3T9_POPJA